MAAAIRKIFLIFHLLPDHIPRFRLVYASFFRHSRRLNRRKDSVMYLFMSRHFYEIIPAHKAIVGTNTICPAKRPCRVTWRAPGRDTGGRLVGLQGYHDHNWNHHIRLVILPPTTAFFHLEAAYVT